jgi:glycosyltransferase involved in cell wall biosynthesis
MRILMLGWEFPPFISGGLGTACYGLTKAMAGEGIDITFVLPTAHPDYQPGHLKVLGSRGYAKTEQLPEEVKIKKVYSPLKPYTITADDNSETPQSERRFRHFWQSEGSNENELYGKDLHRQVHEYVHKLLEIADVEEFDIIHAHDWMTYPAGIALSGKTGKPLVAHIHSTEFDRSGENVNQMVYDIERRGFHESDKIIAVSNYTKNILVHRYGVAPNKVEVVYNGVDLPDSDTGSSGLFPRKDEKVVLFLGRVTMQKGPEYFIQAAKRVLEKMENVKFVMAGTGDMLARMIEMSASMGIGRKVLFAKFLKGIEVDRAFRMADLCVMPSVSEPFGIVPLESLHRNVPVLISRQSGVSEVLHHTLKVDFWDIEKMADKIIAVLSHPPLYGMLRDNGKREVEKLSWKNAAERIVRVYDNVLTSEGLNLQR